MKPSAWLPSSEPCDSETVLAALNALSEGLFVVEPETNTFRPLNAAAAAMLAQSDRSENLWAELPLDRYFPDVDFSSVAVDADSAASSQLVHFPCANSSGLCDVWVQFRPLRDRDGGARDSLLAIVRPIEVKASAEGLSPRDAFDDGFHDALTRLPNRKLFARRLERALRRSATSDYHFAVLFVDLDRFKAANDQFGHLLGDRLLVAAARRLVEAIRPQDMVARRDGDEFTILLDDLERPEDASIVADRIVEHFRAPFLVESLDGRAVEFVLGASVGVALPSVHQGAGRHEQELMTADQLTAQADAAMYQAKSLGGGTFVVFCAGSGKPKPR